jgi:hypothetical protein
MLGTIEASSGGKPDDASFRSEIVLSGGENPERSGPCKKKKSTSVC